MRKKLLAVDGNSILNRAFYGIRPLTTRTGFPTNALYGIVTMISRQAEALCPDYLAVAFDLQAERDDTFNCTVRMLIERNVSHPFAEEFFGVVVN